MAIVATRWPMSLMPAPLTPLARPRPRKPRGYEKPLRLVAKAFKSHYWRPGTDFIKEALRLVGGALKDGDFLIISEKAVSTALGKLVDEAEVEASSLARLLAYWTRAIWGHVLGPFCKLRPETLAKLRSYPLEEGASHKQVALRLKGLLAAMMWGSEGGIDGSNLPFSLVSLPLEPEEAQDIASELAKRVRTELGRAVVALIIDSDRTYSLGPLHISPRKTALRGIIGGLGIVAYVLGNALRLKGRPTPVASSEPSLGPELALRIASLAEKAMGHGAGRDVWEMASRFGVGLTEVTWDMLDSVPHRPVAIVRALKRRVLRHRRLPQWPSRRLVQGA